MNSVVTLWGVRANQNSKSARRSERVEEDTDARLKWSAEHYHKRPNPPLGCGPETSQPDLIFSSLVLEEVAILDLSTWGWALTLAWSSGDWIEEQTAVALSSSVGFVFEDFSEKLMSRPQLMPE
ncbi:hypothetical protein M378DRAFT_159683 [Amanita muscaria Koide BX008]|uniref:Uncharacterized protein n=1 Tax=Amanita muscaria (strain Koide BX008) TaxID=946122 RepID=A0A0C2XEL9_AMAMK|nr:hypothetical protein M378DRAFT_159683 [Amanita muscaria Koide BX008]